MLGTVIRFAAANPLTASFGVLALVITLVQVTFVNPYINPDSDGFLNTAQLQLQFAFFDEVGREVVQSWGPGAAERYLEVIWIDLLWPFTYGPFFALLIYTLGGRMIWALIPLVEGVSNLIETGLEIYWMINLDEPGSLATLFFVHSVVAAFKWLVCVPSYFGKTLWLLARVYRRRTGE